MRQTDNYRLKPLNVKPVPWVPYLSIVGFSGSGKTTLMERLIGELTRRGGDCVSERSNTTLTDLRWTVPARIAGGINRPARRSP
ncbi:MAG: molybdopterin-guanine dinucleotide biosynthesis protein MobB [Desulfosarcina sp.]|nr:molybdopterin-guanine dinucleotide biosynthesis protein MobB [Desulfobacterales bacterium]